MDKTVIGIALFALVIVVGLIIGLRLSSPGPQRKAVGIAFGLMAAITALFYVFAVVLSLSWAPFAFAAVSVFVPVLTYGLIVRHAKAPITVSRRNPNDPPRPVRGESGALSDQQGSPYDSGSMAVVTTRPDDYYDDEDDELDEEYYEDTEDDSASDWEEEDAAEEVVTEPEPVSAELAEAFIDEYLVGENEIEDGFFEPEPSPTLRPHKDPDPIVSSSMMVTVPHPEGDERFLVVSESHEPANPILAFRRTTSSHLVHLGVAKNGEASEAPLIAAALAAQNGVYTVPAASELHVAGRDSDVSEPVATPAPAAAAAAVAGEVLVSAAPDAAASAGEDFDSERVPKHARAKHAPKPASVEAAPAPSYEAAPTPAPAPAPVYEPAPAPAPVFEPVPSSAPKPVESEPAAAPDFSFSLETVFEPAPAPAPAAPVIDASSSVYDDDIPF